MRAEYDIDQLVSKKKKISPIAGTLKIPLNMEMDATIMCELVYKAQELGISKKTLIASILAQYVRGELVSKAMHDELKDLIVRIKKEVA